MRSVAYGERNKESAALSVHKNRLSVAAVIFMYSAVGKGQRLYSFALDKISM